MGTRPGGGQVQQDVLAARVGAAVALAQQGRRSEAVEAIAVLWTELGDDGDPLHRCALAHHMADVQDDPVEALAWDLRALEAADALTDERAAAAGVVGSVAAFYPSLHLNLAEDYRRLGRLDDARRHLELGRRVAAALPDDGYGAMIRGGLDRLAERLAERLSERLSD